MNSLQSLYSQIIFFFSTLTWFGLVDLLLVTATFYFLLSLVRRSSAAYLLREVLFLGVILFVLVTLMPLPVFDWLVRAILVVTLVAIPIIFQTQLRHFIERTGRIVGLSQAARQGAIDNVLPELVQAVESMAAGKTGALIVLENTESLEEVIQSGVSFKGEVTSELLESIFYPGTPLHDGAVIIRANQIVAAGCVLPLTQQSLTSEKRLGTRHRAAVGLSETCDALAIVVSEETGYIAAAQHGELKRPLASAELWDKLMNLYASTEESSPPVSLPTLMKQAAQQLWQAASLSDPHRLVSNIGLLGISLLLALIVWTFVIEQTNPIKLARVENIPLRLENVPPQISIIPAPPTSVSAIVQTTEDVLSTLSPRAFQAVASFQTSAPGLYRLPVRVNSGEARVLVTAVDPPALDLELTPIISRAVSVQIEIPPQQELSAAYELVGAPKPVPDQVEVVGSAPLVAQISQVQVTISLAGVGGPLRELRPVRALDEQGREVVGVSVQPNRVQVSVAVRRRLNVSQVSVRAVTSGTPIPGYWLSSLSVTPASVTLQGRPDQLAEIGGYVDTLPVDISAAAGEMRVQIPLDLPPQVQAVDGEGKMVEAVTVLAQIAARTGDLTLTRPVELLIKPTPNLTVTLNPPTVDLLLSGPLPTLQNIETNPDLVKVSLDTTGLQAGQRVELSPSVVAPANIQTQLVPATILVIIE